MADVAWISHRGLRDKHVENTRLAFDAAVDAGFRHLETDLRSTRDGHIVLHHDPVMTATAGCDRPIEQMTLAEFHAIEMLDGQCGFSFAEFVDRYAACQWILDIKPESADRTLLLLKKWVVQQSAEDWLLEQARFLTWRRQDAQLLQRLLPSAETMATIGECRRAGLATVLGLPVLGGIRPGRTYALPPRIAGKELYEPRIFEAYQQRGARVLAFLPQSDEDVDNALEAGADEFLLDGTPQQPIS